MLKAVLFDFDGVLVNSMLFHVKAWQDVLSEYEVIVQPEDVLLREGSRAIELARKIFEERGLRISEDDLSELVVKKQQRYREITKAQVESNTEVFLNKLKYQNLLIGLVTGSPRQNVEFILQPPLLSSFDTIITNDETLNGKPNPECFLNAARALAVSPETCLVVENAPLGIQAAKSAGMRVAALTTTLERNYLGGADFFASNLKELEANWESLQADFGIFPRVEFVRDFRNDLSRI